MSDWDPRPSYEIAEDYRFNEAIKSLSREERRAVIEFIRKLKSCRPKKRNKNKLGRSVARKRVNRT